MRRLHLFELEDQPWCPSVLRDGATAYLELMTRLSGHARRLAPLVRWALGPETHMVDLCSGGGGPMETLLEELPAHITATLTDRFPNQAAVRRSGGRITYLSQSVDARAVPPELKGMTTLFNAFHHFRPADARAILANAVERGQPIAVFEIVSRRLLCIMPILPLLMWLTYPLVRSCRPQWLFFTYVLPLIPLLCCWDGMVSCLRVYSAEELRELTAGLDSFHWEWGTFPFRPGRGTYLVGRPKLSVEHQPQ